MIIFLILPIILNVLLSKESVQLIFPARFEQSSVKFDASNTETNV